MIWCVTKESDTTYAELTCDNIKPQNSFKLYDKQSRIQLKIVKMHLRYLLDCYSVLSHSSNQQWPSKAAADISIPHAYFDLILCDPPLNIPNSSLPVNESCFKAVTLHDALTKRKEQIDYLFILKVLLAPLRPFFPGTLVGSGVKNESYSTSSFSFMLS